MDRLRLAGGEEIKFEESHMVCGQCHGNVYNDWKKGIHGKRTGSWNGKKEYFLCVHCHDPHSPPFRALKPEPPPVSPEKTLFRRAK
jgi:formate-dependent nitrite reductase cytochrome c552 subunit